MAASRKHAQSVRLVARHVSELTFARWLRWKALVPNERLSAFVFDLVLSASIAHHPFRDPALGQWIGIEDALILGRPVTGTAMARSMRLPHTTVRRQAAELVDAGLLARDVGGFRIAPTIFIDGSINGFAVADAADLTRSLEALAHSHYAPAVVALEAGVAALPAGVVARVVVAFALRAMETFTELYDDVATGTIVSGIIAANVRHITEDPALARLYAGEDTPPPDEMRRPVAVRALSRQLDIPFETVRRRVAALIAEGRVTWLADGVIVPSRVLLSDRHIDNNRRIILHFEQMLTTLTALATDIRR